MTLGTELDDSGLLRVRAGRASLEGELTLPDDAVGVVVFAHGSGSSRRSPRNHFVARHLRDHARVGTLLVDLLTEQEERLDRRTSSLRFDVGLLAERVLAAVEAVRAISEAHVLPVGLFGASTGAAAALVAAAHQPAEIAAVVSRGGRPDLAASALPLVRAPTLLVVGGRDRDVLELNRLAARHLVSAPHALEVVPDAGHLFEEPGALPEVARLAAQWLVRHIGRRPLLHA